MEKLSPGLQYKSIDQYNPFLFILLRYFVYGMERFATSGARVNLGLGVGVGGRRQRSTLREKIPCYVVRRRSNVHCSLHVGQLAIYGNVCSLCVCKTVPRKVDIKVRTTSTGESWECCLGLEALVVGK